jgi:hypothetical protein
VHRGWSGGGARSLPSLVRLLALTAGGCLDFVRESGVLPMRAIMFLRQAVVVGLRGQRGDSDAGDPREPRTAHLLSRIRTEHEAVRTILDTVAASPRP